MDDHLVAHRTGLVRTYHPFTKHPGNPVMIADRPWEGRNIYVYGTILHNESGPGYRLWYHCLNLQAPSDRARALYATSIDGLAWTKPALGIVSYNGSTDNNIFITPGSFPSVMHTPWDAARPYKLVRLGSAGRFLGSWSADGIHWTDSPNNPVIPPVSDVANFVWDQHRERYMGYPKVPATVNNLRRRAVGFFATQDFESWPAASLILEPDAVDDRWVPAGTIQRTHFYGLCAFAYESMYIGFLWIFRATDPEGYYDGPIFVELVSSHDGVHWIRQEGNRPPILPKGAPGSWDYGMVFTTTHPLVEGDTIRLYYGGANDYHAQEQDWVISIGLATLRKDGFASLDAGAEAGSVTTKTLAGASGPLRVNCTATGGSLRAEVQDAAGHVLPGYAAADCVPIQTDGVSQAVSWAAHAELPTEPTGIRLRFVLQNASIYSFMAGEHVSIVDTPPAIANVRVTDLRSTQAVLRFETDRPAAAIMRYGLSCDALSTTTAPPNLGTSHAFPLEGLAPNKTYFFSIEVTDTAGVTATSDNLGACHAFTTLPPPDYFTEVFSGGSDAFNLAHSSVAFRPDGSRSFYTACTHGSLAALPTDPSGGTPLALADNGFATVTLSAGATVRHFGQPYNRLYVGSNGYVTFGSGDSSFSRTLANHFSRLRIAALLDNLNPAAAGAVTWKQLSDRVAVTWDRVPENGTMNANTFQVEMFYSGDIRISWLDVASTASIVGLSGTTGGQPSDFGESLLSAYPTCTYRPIAFGASLVTRARTPLEIDLVATDDGLPDPPGGLTTIITALPSRGLLEDVEAGAIASAPWELALGGSQVRYTPGANYRGEDSFRFTVHDGGVPPGGGQSDEVTIELTADDAPADLDHDGDVDQEDFGVLQRCLSGAFIPQPDPECIEARLDPDTDVDDADFLKWTECYTAPNVWGDVNCGK